MDLNALAEHHLKEYRENSNTTALGNLYSLLAPSVFSFVWSMLKNEEEAKDIVQDTFMIVATKADQYRMGTSVRNWIFEIARNLTLAKLKKKQREVSLAVADPVGALGSYQTIIHETPTLDLAKKVLPSDEYEILILYIGANLKHREIAEKLNIPLGTVTWKYKKALDTLRQIVKKGG